MSTGAKKAVVSLMICALNVVVAVTSVHEMPRWSLVGAFIAGTALMLAAWEFSES